MIISSFKHTGCFIYIQSSRVAFPASAHSTSTFVAATRVCRQGTALYVSEASYILLMQLAPYLAHRETIQLTSDKICDSSFRLTMVWWLSFGLGSNNEFSSYIKHRPSLEPRWNDPEKKLNYFNINIFNYY